MAARSLLYTAAALAAAFGTLSYLVAQNEVAPLPEPPLSGFAALPPLDQLLAPIALYPDPILGLILPAVTQPNDLAAVARLHRLEEIARSPWDPAVKGLAHYPELTRWLADNPQWSKQLGAAFAEQPDEVMDAVQDLRRRAATAGTLHSTAQITLVRDNAVIALFPRATDRIYLPQYEPKGIFLSTRGADHAMTWSDALPAGAWLIYCPMWRQHALWTGDWFAASQRHGDWRGGIASAGGGFFGAAVMGRAHAWQLADNAQIRGSNVRWGERGATVLPSSQRARSRSTFEGDTGVSP